MPVKRCDKKERQKQRKNVRKNVHRLNENFMSFIYYQQRKNRKKHDKIMNGGGKRCTIEHSDAKCKMQNEENI